jgi:hypothetical protein
MAYTIEVENDQPSDARKIQVYHHHHDPAQCPGKKCILTDSGPNSTKGFSLDLADDYLEIQVINPEHPKPPDPKKSEHYITLPKLASYHFYPNGNSNEVYNKDGRTKVLIHENQVPKWKLRIHRPAKFWFTFFKTSNDNVSVREDGG